MPVVHALAVWKPSKTPTLMNEVEIQLFALFWLGFHLKEAFNLAGRWLLSGRENLQRKKSTLSRTA